MPSTTTCAGPCGGRVHVGPGSLPTGASYCRACRKALGGVAYGGRPRAVRTTAACPECGKSFVPKRSRKGFTRTCSRRCAQVKPRRQCRTCGKTCTQARDVYCSMACRNAAYRKRFPSSRVYWCPCGAYIGSHKGACHACSVPPLTCWICSKVMSRGSASRPQGGAACYDCRRALGGVSRDGTLVADTRAARCQDAKQRRRARIAGGRVELYRRADIFARDDWRCQLCDGDVNPEVVYPHPLSASIDHVVAIALGGADAPDNVQLAHLRCNVVKGVRSVVAV